MQAGELKEGDWFRWSRDGRACERLAGGVKIIGGKDCVPVHPLQPVPSEPGGYVPISDEVTLLTHKAVRLN